MAKVKAYYDTELLLGLTDEMGFYSYEVEVTPNALAQAKSIRAFLAALESMVQNKGFPQDAQEIADFVEAELAYLMKAQKRRAKNVSIDDAERPE